VVSEVLRRGKDTLGPGERDKRSLAHQVFRASNKSIPMPAREAEDPGVEASTLHPPGGRLRLLHAPLPHALYSH
jgi:hypothetical protein